MQKITFYGASWCGDCRKPKQFLDEHNIAYTYKDIGKYPKAALEVEKINNGMQSIPTIVLPNGVILVEPSVRELAQELNNLF